jgi:hypothetical protein
MYLPGNPTHSSLIIRKTHVPHTTQLLAPNSSGGLGFLSLSCPGAPAVFLRSIHSICPCPCPCFLPNPSVHVPKPTPRSTYIATPTIPRIQEEDIYIHSRQCNTTLRSDAPRHPRPASHRTAVPSLACQWSTPLVLFTRRKLTLNALRPQIAKLRQSSQSQSSPPRALKLNSFLINLVLTTQILSYSLIQPQL